MPQHVSASPTERDGNSRDRKREKERGGDVEGERQREGVERTRQGGGGTIIASCLLILSQARWNCAKGGVE